MAALVRPWDVSSRSSCRSSGRSASGGGVAPTAGRSETSWVEALPRTSLMSRCSATFLSISLRRSVARWRGVRAPWRHGAAIPFAARRSRISHARRRRVNRANRRRRGRALRDASDRPRSDPLSCRGVPAGSPAGGCALRGKGASSQNGSLSGRLRRAVTSAACRSNLWRNADHDVRRLVRSHSQRSCGRS